MYKLGTTHILWATGFMAHNYATEELEVVTILPWLHKSAILVMLENWFNKSGGLYRMNFLC